MTTKTMKITTEQKRVLRHRIQLLANKACHEQREMFDKNRRTLEPNVKRVVAKVLNRHRRALAATLQLRVETYRSVSVVADLDRSSGAYDSFKSACDDAIKKAGLDGITDEQCGMAFPSLGIDHVWIPRPDRAQWQALADEIDEAFMSGDAVALLGIIEKFSK